jgi:hypothetical protein
MTWRPRWLNRTVLGIGLASLFSDWSHEIATTLLPTFLASMGVAAAWLGLIEGVSDGLSSFAEMASGYYTDRLRRRKPNRARAIICNRGSRGSTPSAGTSSLTLQSRSCYAFH